MKPMIEQFRDFCASKPADERYYYGDAEKCAIGQFFLSVDPETTVYSSRFYICHGEKVRLPEEAYKAANYVAPKTFGALAESLDRIAEGAGI